MSTLLGRAQIGADEDFFDLGGNSLLATRVIPQVNAVLGSHVSIRDFFEDPTVAGVAKAIEHASTTTRIPLMAVAPRPSHIPLAPAQERIWYANQASRDGDWNLPIALRIRGPVDLDVLDIATADLLARHESLRTIYPNSPDGPRQVILTPDAAQPKIVKLVVSEDYLSVPLQEFVWGNFDVATEPPLRLRLFELAANDYVLAVVVHHIAADGLSLGPLSRDVMTAYSARSVDLAPQLEPLSVQYADYTLWKNVSLGSPEDPNSEFSRQINYWTDVLVDYHSPLQWSTAKATQAPPSSAGATLPFVLDEASHADVAAMSTELSATVFMIVQAKFAILVSRLAGTPRVTLATAVAGRGERALEDVIGSLADDVLMRLTVDESMPFEHLVAQVRRSALGAFGHADVSTLQIQRALGTDDRLFQVQLVIVPGGPATEETDLTTLGINLHPIGIDVAKHDIEFSLTEHRDAAGRPAGITGSMIYPTDLFDADAAQAIVDDLQNSLRSGRNSTSPT